jgi:hypothetical protein
MSICVSRGLANRCAGCFGSGSQDAGRAEGRRSECLALRGLWEVGHGEGCWRARCTVIGLSPCLDVGSGTTYSVEDREECEQMKEE